MRGTGLGDTGDRDVAGVVSVAGVTGSIEAGGGRVRSCMGVGSDPASGQSAPLHGAAVIGRSCPLDTGCLFW